MRQQRSLTLATPVMIAALLLAGCAPVSTTDTGGATATPTPTPSETPTATPTATAEPSVPVTITCDQLVPLQAMYDYDPNFSLQPDYTPAPGSLAAEAVAEGGIACEWVQQTSGVRIELSVAQPSAAASNAQMNALVSSSNSVPTYGIEGYFQLNGTIGEVQAFPLPYWITAVSPAFVEPGDPAPIIAAMIAALA